MQHAMIPRTVALMALTTTLASTAALPHARAQDDTLRVEVGVEPNVVELGKSFRYTINASVEGRQNIRLVEGPDVRPFSVLGRSQMPQFLIRNGVASRRTTIEYQLRARRLGTITIKGPVLSAGKKVVRGKDLTIKVVERGKAPKQKLLKSQKESAYLEAKVTPDRAPYVGEQMILDYALFVNTRKLSVQPQPPTEPSLDDFWIEELNEQVAGQHQLIRMGARFMERTQLRRYALFPLRAGRTIIDPMTMDLATGGFFQNQRTISVQSKPIVLNVKPLPPGAPDGFEEGNVGQWDLLVTTDTTQAKVGQAITLRVRVSGAGQANSLSLPELPPSDKYRVIHSEEKVSREPEGLLIKGSKTATYSLMPLKAGTLELEPLSFVFFDPLQEQYQTTQSAPVTIEVAQGQAPVDPQIKQVSEARKRSTGEDVLASLLSTLREPKRAVRSGAFGAPLAQSWWYALLLGLPLGLLAALALLPRAHRALTRTTPRRTKKASLREALEMLQQAQQAPAADAYDAIARAIKLYLGTALEVPQGKLTAKELPGALESIGASAQQARELAQILQACTAARYASASQHQPAPTEHIAQAKRLILDLEKARAKGRVRPWATALVMLCAMAGSMSASPDPAFANEPAIAQALSDQDAQRWPQAIAAWEEVLKQTPGHPEVLYNLGTAALRAGELGRARLALESALLHAPNDADIAHNLKVAQRVVQLRAAQRTKRSSRRLDPSDAFWSWDIARRIPVDALAVVLLVLAWLMLAGALLTPRVRSEGARDSLRVALIIGGLTLVSMGAAWGWRAFVMSTVEPGVIMVDDTQLKEGPSELAASLDELPELVSGTKLRIEERRQQWVKVRLSETLTGWVPSASIEAIR